MIIDFILDRIDDIKYYGYDKYELNEDGINYIYEEEKTFDFNYAKDYKNSIAYALNCLEEEDIKKAFTNYLQENGYKHIIPFIEKLRWLSQLNDDECKQITQLYEKTFN